MNDEPLNELSTVWGSLKLGAWGRLPLHVVPPPPLPPSPLAALALELLAKLFLTQIIWQTEECN